MEYLSDQPRCEFPELVPILRYARAATREHHRGRTPPKGRRSDRRSTSDKTGEASRRRMRQDILRAHGPICHICLAGGITDRRALIDLTLKWPDARCFTRDHVVPRSRGGTDEIGNQRPAHKVCNERRGNKALSPEDGPEELEEEA